MDAESESALEDTERFEALLRDYCGDCKQEISALMAALEEDVPRDLRLRQNEPYALLTARLAARLLEERSIFPEAAQWAVETWAVALEIAPGSNRHPAAAPLVVVSENFAPAQKSVSAPLIQSTPAAPPSGNTVFCVSCGAPDNLGSVFCMACGARLFYPDAAPPSATPDAAPDW